MLFLLLAQKSIQRLPRCLDLSSSSLLLLRRTIAVRLLAAANHTKTSKAIVVTNKVLGGTMSFSSRRRNYLLTPHRRDGLIEWMKSMLQHSFVLDSLETTGADTFSHFEVLIEEHRARGGLNADGSSRQPSRLQQLVPTIGLFHTPLPLRTAFEVYNQKHRLTKRKHIQISFNEIRHILNLAQIMALRQRISSEEKVNPSLNPLLVYQSRVNSFISEDSSHSQKADPDTASPPAVEQPLEDTNLPFNGPKLITFDADQTLYSDGANFETNHHLAHYMYQLLRHGVAVAIVTAAGYEYKVDKYEYRLSGLLRYFASKGLSPEECERFYLFGGECNYLMRLNTDYHLQAVQEQGQGGWCSSTQFLPDAPGNWNEDEVTELLNVAESTLQKTVEDLALRARVLRKRRSVGLVPEVPLLLQGNIPRSTPTEIPRENLDETVLRVHEAVSNMRNGAGPRLPFCAFNGGTDAWVDVGNKRVGVQILQSYLGVAPEHSLHIGDQFLNTGNDYAARAVSPCIWIISPQETTYILKTILRLAGVSHHLQEQDGMGGSDAAIDPSLVLPDRLPSQINFAEVERRAQAAKKMDVYTGDMIPSS